MIISSAHPAALMEMIDMPEFKIEKDIPLPRSRFDVTYPWADMEVGDSFAVAKTGRVSRASNLLHSAKQWTLIRDNKRRFKTRTEGDKVRIWRVE